MTERLHHRLADPVVRVPDNGSNCFTAFALSSAASFSTARLRVCGLLDLSSWSVNQFMTWVGALNGKRSLYRKRRLAIAFLINNRLCG